MSVDDFKVAGPKGKRPQIWVDLKKSCLKLDGPTEFRKSVSLGFRQYENEMLEEEVKLHSDFQSDFR